LDAVKQVFFAQGRCVDRGFSGAVPRSAAEEMTGMQQLSYEERVHLARVIMQLLRGWGVRPAQQIAILGLPQGTPTRSLRRYSEGAPLPDEREVTQRVEHLLGIADALRTMYPGNSRMGAFWLNRPHRQLGARTPLSIMIDDGLSGLITVRATLDCTYAWDLTGSHC
jgi:uncharacterized protein (DUF2384 family)